MIADFPMKESPIYKLLKNSGYLMVATIIVHGTSFLFRSITARQFGPQQYGYLALGIAIVSIGSTVALAGFQSAVRRYLPEYLQDNDHEKINGSLLFTFGFVAVIGTGLVVSTVVFTDKISVIFFGGVSRQDLVIVFAIGIPLAAFQKLAENTLLGLKRFRTNAVIRVVGRGGLLNLTFAVALLSTGSSLYKVSVAYISTIGLAAALAVFVILRDVKSPFSTTTFESKRWLRFAVPLLISSSIGLILSWSDTVLISILESASAVGLYNTGYPFGMMLAAIVPIFASVLVPLGTELYQQNEVGELSYLFETLRYILFVLVTPGVMFVVFNRTTLMEVVFGVKYVEAAPIFLIIAVTNFVVSVTGPITALLQIFEDTRLLLVINSVGAGLNILLDLLLIPIYSIVGAAIAYGIAIITVNVLMLWFGAKRTETADLQLSYGRPFVVSVGCTAMTAYAFQVTTPSVFLAVVLALTTMISYLWILYYLGTFQFIWEEQDVRLNIN